MVPMVLLLDQMLKLASPAIIPALTNFYNHSLSIGCIPSQWKCANVVPVYKRGDKTNMLNYRLVSLTSIVYKLLEKVVVKQLLDHCLDNGLITSQQHGFLPGRSCTTALVSATNDWLSSLDSRVPAVDLVSLDFSQAFDTISQDILIKKLTCSLCYNVSATALCWINSFVSDRVQRVVYKGVSSDCLSIYQLRGTCTSRICTWPVIRIFKTT